MSDTPTPRTDAEDEEPCFAVGGGFASSARINADKNRRIAELERELAAKAHALWETALGEVEAGQWGSVRDRFTDATIAKMKDALASPETKQRAG